MAILPIVRAPDPVLRTVCSDVNVFDQALRDLAEDMLATMYDASGRGLAAPQVGLTRRLFVVDAQWKDEDPQPVIFVNPTITSQSGETDEMEEGCLSIPDTPCLVTRPIGVSVEWRDPEGAPQAGAFDGIWARCIQHELDHLNGVLCTDYAS